MSVLDKTDLYKDCFAFREKPGFPCVSTVILSVYYQLTTLENKNVICGDLKFNN